MIQCKNMNGTYKCKDLNGMGTRFVRGGGGLACMVPWPLCADPILLALPDLCMLVG